MKKILITLLVLIQATSYAQKNVIKLNVPALALGGVAVQYERDVLPLINLQVGAGVYGRKDVNPFGLFPAMERVGASAGGFAFHGELRIYPNILKDGPRGFYIAPYGKIGRYNLGFKNELTASIPVTSGTTTIDTETNLEFEIEGSMRMQAFGLQFGHQWLLLKKVAINLYLMGPGVSFYDIDLSAALQYTVDANTTVTANDIANDPNAQNQMLQAYLERFENIPFIGKKLSTVSMDINASQDGTIGYSVDGFELNYIPRLRMGLSIGIAL